MQNAHSQVIALDIEWKATYYRHRMVENVFFKTSQTEHISFGKMDPEKFMTAISNYKDGIKGFATEDKFLQKIHVASGALPHSDRAAKTARQRMLSYIAYFGQPAGMFTVAPEDNFNFKSEQRNCNCFIRWVLILSRISSRINLESDAQ